MTKALKKLGKQAAKAAVKHVDLKKADPGDEANDALDWTILVDPTKEELETVAQDGGRHALLQLGIDDEDVTKQVFATAAEWASARAAELVGMRYDADGELVENPDAELAISTDVRGAVRQAIADAIANGSSAAELSRSIQSLYDFSADRATTIARTEIIRANNQGHLAAFRESGVVRLKEWSTAEDEEVCPVCEANEDEGPIALGEDFESGDDAAPAHPECRCTIVAVVDGAA